MTKWKKRCSHGETFVRFMGLIQEANRCDAPFNARTPTAMQATLPKSLGRVISQTWRMHRHLFIGFDARWNKFFLARPRQYLFDCACQRTENQPDATPLVNSRERLG
jgi:hypothetical protein